MLSPMFIHLMLNLLAKIGLFVLRLCALTPYAILLVPNFTGDSDFILSPRQGQGKGKGKMPESSGSRPVKKSTGKKACPPSMAPNAKRTKRHNPHEPVSNDWTKMSTDDYVAARDIFSLCL